MLWRKVVTCDCRYGKFETFYNFHLIYRPGCWQIIADNLSKDGWTWGCVSGVDCRRRTICITDAHRGDPKRLVVRADEKLTAVVELNL